MVPKLSLPGRAPRGELEIVGSRKIVKEMMTRTMMTNQSHF